MGRSHWYLDVITPFVVHVSELTELASMYGPTDKLTAPDFEMASVILLVGLQKRIPKNWGI
jgi:hypothetical protein